MVANASIAGIVSYFEDLSILIRMSAHNRDHIAQFDPEDVAAASKGDKYQQALTDSCREVEFLLKRTENLLMLAPSDHIDAAAQRLRYWIKKEEKNWGDLFTRACALRDAAKTELKQSLTYMYPREEGKRLNSFVTEWKQTLDAFPSARDDAYRAVDCWALRHPTASVFHSMRVVEVGLRCLAKERKLKLPKNKSVEWATWQEVITALDGEIRRIGTHVRAGKPKDLALSFYSGARADLNGFKDEFRNAVMHVRTDYNDRDAERAITQVQAFMGRLSGRISEAKGTPKSRNTKISSAPGSAPTPASPPPA